jgi:branched-chain amino acid aminotransferase
MYEELVSWYNGGFCLLKDVHISPLDFGFIHSDATYDVFRVVNGRPLFLPLHEARFEQSCNYFGFSPLQNIKDISLELCQKNNLSDAFVWLCVWRGRPPSGSPRDLSGVQNSLIYVKPYYAISQSSAISLTISLDHRRVPDVCYNQRYKNFGWIEFTFAQREANRRSFDSAIVMSPEGFLTEGPGFGICLVKNGKVKTPQSHCLQSVTLQVVEKICAELNVSFERCNLTREEAYNADEAFVGSTSGGVTLVSRIDDHVLGHDLSSKIKEVYNGIKA